MSVRQRCECAERLTSIFGAMRLKVRTSKGKTLMLDDVSEEMTGLELRTMIAEKLDEDVENLTKGNDR